MSDKKIDSDSFYSKLQKICTAWREVSPTPSIRSTLVQPAFSHISAICQVMGKIKEESLRPSTSDFL